MVVRGVSLAFFPFDARGGRFDLLSALLSYSARAPLLSYSTQAPFLSYSAQAPFLSYSAQAPFMF